MLNVVLASLSASALTGAINQVAIGHPDWFIPATLAYLAAYFIRA